MITLNNSLGENLRGLRKGCKLSQERLAEEMGVDPKTISNIENNVTSLSSTMVHKYMEFFHIDANTLFCIKESITQTTEVTEIISIDRLLNTVDPIKRKYLRDTMVMMITEFPA